MITEGDEIVSRLPLETTERQLAMGGMLLDDFMIPDLEVTQDLNAVVAAAKKRNVKTSEIKGVKGFFAKIRGIFKKEGR